MLKKNTSVMVPIALSTIGLFSAVSLTFLYASKQIALSNTVKKAETTANMVLAFRSLLANYGGMWTLNKYKTGFGYLMELEGTNGTEKSYKGTKLGTLPAFHYYLHNPALATREYSEEASNFGVKFRVVSDRYIAEADKPNSFEAKAIKIIKEKLKKGESPEYYEEVGNKVLYAKAIVVKEGCLKCHGSPEDVNPTLIKAMKDKYGENAVDRALGYKVGDLRGIVSVTVNETKTSFASLLSYFKIPIIGMFLGMLFLLALIRQLTVRPLREVNEYVKKLAKGFVDEPPPVDVSSYTEEELKNEYLKLFKNVDKLRHSIKIALKRIKKA